MVGQTSKADPLGPTYWALNWRGCPIIEIGIYKIVDKKFLFFGNSNISNKMRSTPSGQISTFDPPFDAPGLELSSKRRISALRRKWEFLAPHFWKRSRKAEFGPKYVHKVPKNGLSTDCTERSPEHFRQCKLHRIPQLKFGFQLFYVAKMMALGLKFVSLTMTFHLWAKAVE